jgi:hypothetical protein
MRVARLLLALCLSAFPAVMLFAQPANEEPIAYIGHGAFFDRSGRELQPTPEFLASAQKWYRQNLAAKLTAAKKKELASLEKRLADAVPAQGPAVQLFAQQRALDWLASNVPDTDGGRTKGKINALRYALERLAESDDRFKLDPGIQEKLRAIPGGGVVLFLPTVNQGQNYLNECMGNQVPIPPPINQMDPNGLTGWKSQGFIPQAQQFIVGSPAEVRTFQSAQGMCIALPRYNNSQTTVNLDGVICLSKITSRVCIWDNQMGGSAFAFPAGTKIPIGVADLTVDPSGRYQGGGFELSVNGAVGGICTDCHAGENPYIVHPNSNLGSGVLMGSLGSAPQNLPMFAPNRYDPIVAGSWPQNDLSQAAAFVPPQCGACHFKGNAGRFPHLSNALPGYCGTILAQAVVKTMPPGAPGSLATDPAIVAFRAWCNGPPNSTSEDAGDPHLTTTNGVHYDFQSAGEFITLRNSDTGFQLQTRQSPVSTTFTPGANAYTGLASCVSLNTAAALRLGRHRVTYQPGPRGGSAMQVRIDGTLVDLPRTPVNLGGGNTVAAADQQGGLDVHTDDGTHVIITSNFWTTQGYWYLNVDVLNTTAREGTMGHILGSDFLPLAPNGSSFGPRPPLIPNRHTLLNKTFANAWRVTTTTSLFDYAAGTSTATFTNADWPPPPGDKCVLPAQKPVEGMNRQRAVKLCEPVKDKQDLENCVFDLVATGEAGFAKAYVRSLALRKAKGASRPGDLTALEKPEPK